MYKFYKFSDKDYKRLILFDNLFWTILLEFLSSFLPRSKLFDFDLILKILAIFQAEIEVKTTPLSHGLSNGNV